MPWTIGAPRSTTNLTRDSDMDAFSWWRPEGKSPADLKRHGWRHYEGEGNDRPLRPEWEVPRFAEGDEEAEADRVRGRKGVT